MEQEAVFARWIRRTVCGFCSPPGLEQAVWARVADHISDDRPPPEDPLAGNGSRANPGSGSRDPPA